MESMSSLNLLQLVFLTLALVMAIFGFIINYGDRYLPSAFVQIFRYGRANISKSKASFVTAIEVPKRWFAHFYLFSVITQSFIVYSILRVYIYQDEGIFLKKILEFVAGENRNTTISCSTTILVASMFWIQVTRRLYETVFVSVYSDTKMNIFHYLLAFVHYAGSMLSIIAHSPEFSASSQDKPVSWADIKVFQMVAVILFLYGTVEQYKAHLGYANLRKKDEKVVTYGHKIPTGGLFELVSCPNYFAEMIIYSSIACVFEFQNTTWNYVAAWVIANQITSGVMNHKWYLEKFPEYPKQRKAVIPFVY